MFLFLYIATIYVCNAADVFSISGNKVMKNGEWIVFNGISLTCTEYMMRINMGPLWAYQHCFGGVSKMNPKTYSLNQEPGNLVNMLVNNFELEPTIKKVQFKAPYDEIIDMESPKHHPLVRIPTTASTYLYDADCVTGDHMDYVNSLDLIITYLTNHSIAVAFDLHWSCPNPTALNCSGTAQTAMALKQFGAGNMGTVDFWDAVSKRYASNPYVFYELYNEPYLKNGEDQFDIYYNGNDEYEGMKNMYNIVRKNDPNGLIILAGSQQWAFDAGSQIAFWLRYNNDYGTYPTNVILNYHPYQGSHQGDEKSPQGAIRLTNAGKTLAPVIFTEFGQYGCGESVEKCPNGQAGPCDNHVTGDNFVYNVINLALQYDISWTAWAWWGSTPYSCDGHIQNNLRNENGSYVSNGTYGGAPWILIWKDFINNKNPTVKDLQYNSVTVNVEPTTNEIAGYLPRPCIMGDYNLGNHCGYALGTNISTLNYTQFTAQNVYGSILPGIPPFGNCSAQGCPTHQCGYTSPACPSHDR